MGGIAVRGGSRPHAEVSRGTDACVAFAAPGPGIIRPECVRGMARDAIVFACANPVPEIWPWEATAAGARVVATGRSDFPNQLNSSLVFPRPVPRRLPRMDEWDVFPRVAVAAATAAPAQGLARHSESPAELHDRRPGRCARRAGSSSRPT